MMTTAQREGTLADALAHRPDVEPEVVARVAACERALRQLADHGLGALPDDAHRWDAADWFEHLHRIEQTVRETATRALHG